MGKKQDVLTEIFNICQENGNFEFDNELVKKVTKKIGFGNQKDISLVKLIKSAQYNLIKH